MKLKFKILSFLASLAILIIVLGQYSCENQHTENATKKVVKTIAKTVPKANIKFGLNLDNFKVYKNVIKPNEFLANILLKYNIPYPKIDLLAKQSKEVFDVRKIASGKEYTVLCSKGSTEKAEYFIYEPNAVEYVVFDIRDSINIYKEEKPITTEIKTASGIINSSLYQTLDNEGVTPVLAIEMANVYAWAIDFYRIQKGDWFKVIYEEKMVDGKSVGIGKVLATEFNHEGKDYFAYYFEQGDIPDYFDEKANSLRKAFLKSPLKFGRLTSGFTMRRFHPVQKRNKPHLGTDYAAPTGTPIMATGNGKVIASSYSKYNGNFVKVKHNSTYTTQYLHMSKRAAKVGDVVKQGDIIGYVGSTGLATGPHVCYRFWKFGKQVNHLKEDFPPSEPIKTEYKEAFEKNRAKFNLELDKIQIEKENS